MFTDDKAEVENTEKKLIENTQGSVEAAEALEEIITYLRKNPIFASAAGAQH